MLQTAASITPETFFFSFSVKKFAVKKYDEFGIPVDELDVVGQSPGLHSLPMWRS